MAYPYRVALTDEQRAHLRTLVGSGTAPARMLTRARILLKADHGEGGPGRSDAAIVAPLDVNASTVLRVRRQFVPDGLDTTLVRQRPDRVYARRLDGVQEAPPQAVAHDEAQAVEDLAQSWRRCRAASSISIRERATNAHSSSETSLG